MAPPVPYATIPVVTQEIREAVAATGEDNGPEYGKV